MFPRSFSQLLVCSVLFLWFSCSIAVSQEPAAPKKPAAKENDKRDLNFDAKKLVESLKNSNSPPKISRVEADSEAKAEFGKNYDFEEQKRIDTAIQKLARQADLAWPELVKHLDNQQYAITYSIVGSADNWSIGEVCEQIISDWISQAYYQHLPQSSKDN